MNITNTFQYILKNSPTKYERINTIKYVNDILELVETDEELLAMMVSIERVEKEFEVKLNTSKTKVIHIGKEDSTL